MINFEIFTQHYQLFLYGMLMSLRIALLSCALGILLGGISGIILSGKNLIARWIVSGYVGIIRGTPMLIQVAATYYLLKYFGVPICALHSAILSIGLNSGAYMSQIVLSGIKSVHKGQVEAAKVLGFSSRQITQLIVLPQAIRTMIPAFGNEFITLIKDSSLASTIGVYELTKQGSIVMSQTYDAPTVYVILAVSYLCMTSLISLLVSKLDKKLNYHAHR